MEMGEKCLILHIFSQHCCEWGGYGGSIWEKRTLSKIGHVRDIVLEIVSCQGLK